MSLKLVAPAAEPLVDTAEAMLYARIDNDDETDMVAGLVQAAGSRIEAFLGRAVAPQLWALSLDRFEEVMELRHGPVISLEAITYLDRDREEQVLDAGAYILDLISNPSRVVREAGQGWPVTASVPNAVTITYMAGFDGDAPAMAAIRQACLATVAHWYDNRGSMILPQGVRELLRPWRAIRI